MSGSTYGQATTIPCSPSLPPFPPSPPPVPLLNCASASSYVRDVCSATNVKVVTKGLALAMDMSHYIEAKTRQQIAALYNIDASLMSLAVVGGSVQLTMSIATSGSPGEPTISSILSSVNAVSDQALSAALGVSVTSTPPQLICPSGANPTVANFAQMCLKGARSPAQRARKTLAAPASHAHPAASALGVWPFAAPFTPG